MEQLFYDKNMVNPYNASNLSFAITLREDAPSFARNILRLHAAKIGAVNDKTQKVLSLTINIRNELMRLL